MDNYANIERCCQLHEEVRIYYTVDGYRASLDLADGDVPGCYAEGKTIEEALARLDRIVGAFASVSSYRASFFKGRTS